MKKLTVISICVVLMLGLSFSSPVMASDEDDVLKVINSFNQNFNTSDFDKMSQLYYHSDKTSEFSPDSPPFLTQGWDLLKESWKTTPDIPPGTFVTSLHNSKVTMLTDNVAIFTGYMTATYTNPTTKAQSVDSARQTFVLQKIDGKWLIVHNHASMLPIE